MSPSPLRHPPHGSPSSLPPGTRRAAARKAWLPALAALALVVVPATASAALPAIIDQGVPLVLLLAGQMAPSIPCVTDEPGCPDLPCLTDTTACPPASCVTEVSTCPATVPDPVPCSAWGWTATPPAAGARPPNDDFACATVVHGSPSATQVDLTLATQEAGEPKECYWMGGNTVWYAWTPAVGGMATVSTNNPGTRAGMNTFLAAFIGPTMDTTIGMGCGDTGGPDTLTFRCLPGVTYHIQLGLSSWAPTPPGVAALTISGCEGVALPVGTAPNSNDVASVTGPLVPAAPCLQDASACPPAPCAVDPASCPAVPCVNDVPTCPPGVPGTPCATWGLFDAPATQGRPVHDDFDCARVVRASPFAHQVDLTGASQEPGEFGGCGFSSEVHSVWYRWTPASPGVATVTTDDPRTNLGLSVGLTAYVVQPSPVIGATPAIRTGAPFGHLERVACDNPAWGSYNTMAFPCTAGQTYFLQVASWNMVLTPDVHVAISGCDGLAVPVGGVPTPLGAAMWAQSPVPRPACLSPTGDCPPVPCVSDGSACPVNGDPVPCNGWGWLAIPRQDGATPANDDLACATPIRSTPFRATGDVRTATREPDEGGPCFAWRSGTVWFRWTPAFSGIAAVTLDDPATTMPNPTFGVYQAVGGGAAGMGEGGCNFRRDAVATFECVPGVTYYIQVSSMDQGVFFPAPGPFGLRVSGCDGAALPVGYTPDQAATNAFVESQKPATPCATDPASCPVPCVGDITTCPPLPCVLDGPTCPVASPPLPCQAYGWVTASSAPDAPPPNDGYDCATVVHSTPFAAAPDLTTATVEPNEINWCATPAASVWYRWTPSSAGTATATATGAGALLGVFTSGMENLPPPLYVFPPVYNQNYQAACADGGLAGHAVMSFDCIAGETFVIQVAAKTGAAPGAMSFNLDGCDGTAIPLGGGPTTLVPHI